MGNLFYGDVAVLFDGDHMVTDLLLLPLLLLLEQAQLPDQAQPTILLLLLPILLLSLLSLLILFLILKFLLIHSSLILLNNLNRYVCERKLVDIVNFRMVFFSRSVIDDSCP